MAKRDAKLRPKTRNLGGRPKGFNAVLEHDRLRDKVLKRMDRMADAQISAAEGVKYLVARNKKGGKFTHLTEERAKAILSGKDHENEIVEEWEKLPNTQAFMYLIDRVFGKPGESVKHEHSGDVVFRWKGEA